MTPNDTAPAPAGAASTSAPDDVEVTSSSAAGSATQTTSEDPVGTRHADVGEGRQAAPLDLSAALALEAAQKGVNCPTPPSAQAVIDAADPDLVAEIRKSQAAEPAAGRRAPRATRTPKE